MVTEILLETSLTNRENETEEEKGGKKNPRFIKIIVSPLLKGVKGETYGVIKRRREITTCRRDKKFDVNRKNAVRSELISRRRN